MQGSWGGDGGIGVLGWPREEITDTDVMLGS